MRIPDIKERFRPIWSMRKTAQMRDETNLTAPRIAVVKSFSDWPVRPNNANNSGAYAIFC